MANKYWVGGTGTWSNSGTTNWSDSSGGAGGAVIPGTSDIVFIDAASLSASSTITISANRSVVSVIITGLDNKLDLVFNGNLTCSNLFQCDGYTGINRTFIKSGTLGTARTISAAAISVSNTDFQDITGAGAATWNLSAITGGSGDCGGNTNITFTTADDWYWHADTGNVSDYTKWYTATNGGGSQMASTLVPLPQDTLHFDASSFDSGSQTITQNMSRIGGIDFTGATNTPTLTTSTAASVFGSITLISGMTLTASTQTYTFAGRGSYTLDSGGKSWNKFIAINLNTGTLTLKSDFYSLEGLQVQTGTFSCVDGANNWAISVLTFSGTNDAKCIITLGSATHLITGSSSAWTMYTSLTLSANTATIKLTGNLSSNFVFTGAGKTYYNIWNATTGNYPLVFSGSNTLNDFKIDAGREVNFTDGTDTTVTSLTAIGTSGSPITMHGTGTAGWKISDTTGTNDCEYLILDYSTAEGGATFNANNSTDGGHNTGWNFPSTANTTNFFNFI